MRIADSETFRDCTEDEIYFIHNWGTWIDFEAAIVTRIAKLGLDPEKYHYVKIYAETYNKACKMVHDYFNLDDNTPDMVKALFTDKCYNATINMLRRFKKKDLNAYLIK